jgi:hypothetical protein
VFKRGKSGFEGHFVLFLVLKSKYLIWFLDHTNVFKLLKVPKQSKDRFGYIQQSKKDGCIG